MASNTIANLHTPHKPVTRFSVKPAFSRLAAWEGVRNQKRSIAKGGIIQMTHKFNNGLENASSGRHALKKRLEQPGYFFERKDDIFWRFKSVAEKTEPVLGEDILDALVVDELCQPDSIWSLRDLQVTCGTLGLSTSTVRLIDADGKEHVACSVGTGPVDSAYKAVDRIVKVPATLLEYSLTTVTKGIDAIATTRVMVSGDDGIKSTHASGDISCHQTFSGSGSEEDIVISSVRAYLSALNKMLSYQNKPNNLKAPDKNFGVSASAAAPAASI